MTTDPIKQTDQEVEIQNMLNQYINGLVWKGDADPTAKLLIGGNIRAFYYWLMKRDDHFRGNPKEQVIAAFQNGFVEALDYACGTGWGEQHRPGAESHLDAIIQVATTGEKISFFDAVRDAPDMSQEQKDYWLAMETGKDAS